MACYAWLVGYSVKADEVMIVAHRGASKDAPENTIPAFKLAWEQGADAVEGDFHLTKDGRIVCIHDADTKKVSNANLVVKQSTLEELRKLDVGSHFGKAFKGTTIPTISEVFSTVPAGKKIYAEVKCGAEIVPALVEQIKASGLAKDQIVVISFHSEVIRELKDLAPQYTANWICSFKNRRGSEISPSLESILKTLQSVKADGISSNHLMPAEFSETVKKQGFDWHVWTVDDFDVARNMKTRGVSSITTNLPKMMREKLVK